MRKSKGAQSESKWKMDENKSNEQLTEHKRKVRRGKKIMEVKNEGITKPGK